MSSILTVTNLKHASSGSNNVVLDGSGNTTVSGTLTTTGNTTVGGTLTSTGNFTTSGTVTSTGNTTLNSGNLVISTAGKGITFSSTNTPAQSAGTGTGNTLDDYEEGTWNGDLKFGGASGTINGQGTGTYTKIGRSVTIHFSVGLNNSSSGSGQVYITGLPFTCGGSDSQATLYTNDFMMTTNVVPIVVNGQTYIIFYILPSSTSSGLASFTNSHIHSSNSGKLIRITATYTVA